MRSAHEFCGIYVFWIIRFTGDRTRQKMKYICHNLYCTSFTFLKVCPPLLDLVSHKIFIFFTLKCRFMNVSTQIIYVCFSSLECIITCRIHNNFSKNLKNDQPTQIFIKLLKEIKYKQNELHFKMKFQICSHIFMYSIILSLNSRF